ncbi:MAG: invasion associated locus B family protein [Pseudomonadota bacterium]
MSNYRQPARLALPVLMLTLTMLPGVVAADDREELLGEFRDWKAMRYFEQDKRVCVMWTDPSAGGAGTRATKPHLFVSHRVSTRSYHEVSVQVGTELKRGSTVDVTIGSQRFTLYSEGDSAWNNALQEDLRMIRAMRAGRSVKISATTTGGQKVNDEYSLLGFTAAHAAVNKECKARY